MVHRVFNDLRAAGVDEAHLRITAQGYLLAELPGERVGGAALAQPGGNPKARMVSEHPAGRVSTSADPNKPGGEAE
jgi:hypothetical protein